MQPTHEHNCTAGDSVLAVSLELSQSSWKVALHDGKRDQPALHTVKSERAGERLKQVLKVIRETQKKWGLLPEIRVVVVYEAGRCWPCQEPYPACLVTMHAPGAAWVLPLQACLRNT